MTYKEGAERFYDLFGAKDDANFYIDLAHRHGDKALELGVGTARLAIQLAREGVDTWGIDNSYYMLRAAEANIAREPAEVQERVHIIQGDVRDFDLGERFGLICFPSFSFDHLITQENQISSLRCIHGHLTQDGVYAFDLSHATEEDSGWFVQRMMLDEEKTIIRVGYHEFHPNKPLKSLHIWYEYYENGRMMERYYEGGEVYIHTVGGVRQLIEENGFQIDSVFGGHDKRPFTEGSEMMVFVARPT